MHFPELLSASCEGQGDHWYEVDCSGAMGRFISVILPGADRVLNFMEIRVYEAQALLGKAQQSSTAGANVASHGNDGKLNTMAHTRGGKGELNPWWQLDLKTTRSIGKIRVKACPHGNFQDK